MDPLLAINILATFFMTGLVWYLQVAHYPLFDLVGEKDFPTLVVEHARRTARIGLPVMLVELVTLIMLGLTSYAALYPAPFWLGAVLLLIIWISTFAVQVPLNTRLTASYDAGVSRRLRETNWIRTIGWSLRSFLSLVVLISHDF